MAAIRLTARTVPHGTREARGRGCATESKKRERERERHKRNQTERERETRIIQRTDYQARHGSTRERERARERERKRSGPLTRRSCVGQSRTTMDIEIDTAAAPPATGNAIHAMPFRVAYSGPGQVRAVRALVKDVRPGAFTATRRVPRRGWTQVTTYFRPTVERAATEDAPAVHLARFRGRALRSRDVAVPADYQGDRPPSQ